MKFLDFFAGVGFRTSVAVVYAGVVVMKLPVIQNQIGNSEMATVGCDFRKLIKELFNL